MKDEEFDSLLEKISSQIGLSNSRKDSESEQVETTEKETAQLRKQLRDIKHSLESEKQENARLHAKLSAPKNIEDHLRTEIERDFYKEQYEKLFAMVTNK